MSDGGLLEIGATVLGRYRLDRVLGAGAVGVVYAATDVRLDRQVAIKLLGRKAAQFRDAHQRLEREARALAGLAHPNLVTVLDYDLLPDGTPAMVMEHVDGVSLKRLMQTHQLHPTEVALVLHQALDALAHCHARGVIHRDLKPGNLLVERDGPHGLNVKVIDLGIAQMLSDDGATALTLNGEVYGSPRYMAPEQWQQEGVDGRTDLYALAMIGYHLLTGQRFVTATNPVDCWRQHVVQPRPRLVQSISGEPIPPALAEAIRRGMQIRREDRFAGAVEMQAVLAPLVGSVRAELPSGAPAWTPADSLEGDVAAVTSAVHALEAGAVDDATQMGTQPFAADDDDDDDDDDDVTHNETAAEPAPSPYLTSLQQPSLAPEPSPPPARERRPHVSEPVRYDGRLGTAITKDDFERALEADRAERAARASAEVPQAQPATPPPEPPAPAPLDETVAVEAPPVHDASAPSLPESVATPAPSSADAQGQSLWLWVAGGVVLGLVSAGIVILLR